MGKGEVLLRSVLTLLLIGGALNQEWRPLLCIDFKGGTVVDVALPAPADRYNSQWADAAGIVNTTIVPVSDIANPNSNDSPNQFEERVKGRRR